MIKKKIAMYLLGIILLASSCTILKDTSVDSKGYLGNKNNLLDIYSDKPKEIIYSPFDFSIETPEKIMLFDFKGHPIYKFVEFQVYNDSIFGKGIVCMLMRHDERLDIYYSEGINLSQKLYFFDSVQHSIQTNKFNPELLFEYKEGKIDFSCKFLDKFNNSIFVSLSAFSPDFIDFLVPVGIINHHYDSYVMFPLWYMHKLNFLTTKNGKAEIKINDTIYPIKKMPGLVNWKRTYFARWSFDSVFCLFNINKSKTDSGLNANLNAIHQNTSYEIIKRGNYSEIKKIAFKERGHIAELEFVPALPEFFCLKDKIMLEGRFVANVDNKTGIIGGEYFIKRIGNKIIIQLKPKKGTQPIPGKSWVNSLFLDIEMIKLSSGNVDINSRWKTNR
jgi:hypothetical protein